MSSQDDSILHDMLEGGSFDLDASDAPASVTPPRARSPVPLERINLVVLPAIELRRKLSPMMVRFLKVSQVIAQMESAGVPSTPASVVTDPAMISEEQKSIYIKQREYEFLKNAILDLLDTYLPNGGFKEGNAPTVLTHAVEILVETKIQDIVLIDRKLFSGYEEIEKLASKPNAYGDYVSKLMEYTRAIRAIALDDSIKLEEEYYYRGALYDQQLKLHDGTQPVASKVEKENLIVEIARLNEENASLEQEINATQDCATRLVLLTANAKEEIYDDPKIILLHGAFDEDEYKRMVKVGMPIHEYPTKTEIHRIIEPGGGLRIREEKRQYRRRVFGDDSTFVEFPPRGIGHSLEILMEWERLLKDLVDKNKKKIYDMIRDKFIHQYMLDKENEKLEQEKQEAIRYENEYPDIIKKCEDIRKKILWMKEDAKEQKLIGRKEEEICDLASRYARKLSLYWTSIEKTFNNMRRDFEYQIGLKKHRNIRTSYNEVYVDPDYEPTSPRQPTQASPQPQQATLASPQPQQAAPTLPQPQQATPTLPQPQRSTPILPQPQQSTPAASREALLKWMFRL